MSDGDVYVERGHAAFRSQDGSIDWIPVDRAGDAALSGRSPISPDDYAAMVAHAKYGGKPLTAAALSALSVATMGRSDRELVRSGVDPRAIAEIRSLSPASSAIGGIAGAVPVAIAGGGIGAGATGAVGRAAAAVARGAAEGAYIGAGSEVSSLAIGESQSTGSSLGDLAAIGKSALRGAALGAAVSAVAPAVSAAARGAPRLATAITDRVSGRLAKKLAAASKPSSPIVTSVDMAAIDAAAINASPLSDTGIAAMRRIEAHAKRAADKRAVASALSGEPITPELAKTLRKLSDRVAKATATDADKIKQVVLKMDKAYNARAQLRELETRVAASTNDAVLAGTATRAEISSLRSVMMNADTRAAREAAREKLESLIPADSLVRHFGRPVLPRGVGAGAINMRIGRVENALKQYRLRLSRLGVSEEVLAAGGSVGASIRRAARDAISESIYQVGGPAARKVFGAASSVAGYLGSEAGTAMLARAGTVARAAVIPTAMRGYGAGASAQADADSMDATSRSTLAEASAEGVAAGQDVAHSMSDRPGLSLDDIDRLIADKEKADKRVQYADAFPTDVSRIDVADASARSSAIEARLAAHRAAVLSDGLSLAATGMAQIGSAVSAAIFASGGPLARLSAGSSTPSRQSALEAIESAKRIDPGKLALEAHLAQPHGTDPRVTSAYADEIERGLSRIRDASIEYDGTRSSMKRFIATVRATISPSTSIEKLAESSISAAERDALESVHPAALDYVRRRAIAAVAMATGSGSMSRQTARDIAAMTGDESYAPSIDRTVTAARLSLILGSAGSGQRPAPARSVSRMQISSARGTRIDRLMR